MGNKQKGFAVWITGLPAAGKSTLARALANQLAARGVELELLESDALRAVFTPNPRYDEEERGIFYSQMVYVGTLLVEHGVSVIFDATANRRSFRDRARQKIAHFLEVYVDSPLDTCIARDPKGIYSKARTQDASHVPGIQIPYEPPQAPDIVVRGDQDSPETAAQRIIATLARRQYIVDEPVKEA